jgi:hypothetical protein
LLIELTIDETYSVVADSVVAEIGRNTAVVNNPAGSLISEEKVVGSIICFVGGFLLAGKDRN